MKLSKNCLDDITKLYYSKNRIYIVGPKNQDYGSYAVFNRSYIPKQYEIKLLIRKRKTGFQEIYNKLKDWYELGKNLFQRKIKRNRSKLEILVTSNNSKKAIESIMKKYEIIDRKDNGIGTDYANNNQNKGPIYKTELKYRGVDYARQRAIEYFVRKLIKENKFSKEIWANYSKLIYAVAKEQEANGSLTEDSIIDEIENMSPRLKKGIVRAVNRKLKEHKTLIRRLKKLRDKRKRITKRSKPKAKAELA